VHTAAIDDPRHAVGHHREHRADAREQEYRRHGQLDRVSDRRNRGVLFHAWHLLLDRVRS
jgi:hypothetical protein